MLGLLINAEHASPHIQPAQETHRTWGKGKARNTASTEWGEAHSSTPNTHPTDMTHTNTPFVGWGDRWWGLHHAPPHHLASTRPSEGGGGGQHVMTSNNQNSVLSLIS